MKWQLGLNRIRGSYFYKTFMFFVIVIFLISSVSFVYYFNLRKKLIDEETYQSKNTVSTIASLVNKELEETEKIVSLMIMNFDEIHNAKLKVGYRDFVKLEYKNLTYLCAQLTRQHNIKESIGNIAVLFVLNDCIVVRDGTFHFDEYFGELNRYNNIDMEVLREPGASKKYINILGPSELERKEINKRIRTMVIPIVFNYEDYEKLNVKIIVDLKAEYLQSKLNNNKYSGETSFVIADENGKIIISSNEDFDTSFNELYTNAKNIENGNILFLGNQRYHIFKNDIPFAKWTVFSFIPEQEFMERPRNVLGVIILVNVVLLIAGLIIAFYFSGRLYSPISNLIKLLSDNTAQEFKSGNMKDNMNDIEFISGHLHALKKINHELSGKISRYGSYVQENVVRNLILFDNSSVSKSEILDLFKTERIKLNKKYYILIYFKLVYSANFYSDFVQEEQEKIKSGIHIVVKESMLQRFEEALYIEISQEAFVILVNTDHEDTQVKALEYIEKLNEILKEDSQYIKMYAYVAEKNTNLQELHEDYKKALDVMENSDLNHAKCLLDESLCVRNPELELPQNFENRLSNTIESRNDTEMRSLLEEAFHCFTKNFRTVEGLKRLSSILEDVYKKEIAKKGLSMSSDGLEDIAQSMGAWNFDGVRSGYLKLFTELIHHIDDLRRETDDETADKRRKELFKEYLEKNYSNENICLETMADDLNFNTSYLSRVIKEVLGKSFSEYLMSLRIEKAMELLENSDMPVDSIAKCVGMNSRATFNRQFKKITSVSPAVYRTIKRRQ